MPPCPESLLGTTDKEGMSSCCSLPDSASQLTRGSAQQAARASLGGGDLGAVQEEARLQALRSLAILDTPPEPELDDLVQLAATLCGAPIGLLSFVDERRQWFKAAVGVDLTEAPRELAFCHYTIQQHDLMLVEDATLDPRFAANPLVTGRTGLRFYAGMPLETSDHHVLGSLCVLDYVPRTLSPSQKSALRILATQVKARLELRAQHRALQEALEEARAAKARAEALEHRFQLFMDAGPFLAFIKDADGRMLYYNELMARQFQVSRTALLNKTDADLWPEALAKAYRAHDLQVFESGTLQICHEETCNPDGSKSVWRSYKFPCVDPSGKVLLGGVSVEVTKDLQRQNELQRSQAELQAANQHLNELASVDPLTGLANRRVFDERMRLAFRQARKNSAPLSVLIMDVDRFKQHNDRFGHSHGDDVLRELASCLNGSVRVQDLVARYGGEEFVAVLPYTPGPEATCLAERLLAKVRGKTWPNAPVTISIGVSTLTPATRDTQHLLGRADEALYAAKCGGRDRVVSYTDAVESLART